MLDVSIQEIGEMILVLLLAGLLATTIVFLDGTGTSFQGFSIETAALASYSAGTESEIRIRIPENIKKEELEIVSTGTQKELRLSESGISRTLSTTEGQRAEMEGEYLVLRN